MDFLGGSVRTSPSLSGGCYLDGREQSCISRNMQGCKERDGREKKRKFVGGKLWSHLKAAMKSGLFLFDHTRLIFFAFYAGFHGKSVCRNFHVKKILRIPRNPHVFGRFTL